MPRRPTTSSALVLAALLLLGACGSSGRGTTSSEPTSPSPTASSSRPALAVTVDQLAGAHLPALCGHPASDLNAGKASFGDDGSVALDLDRAVFTDVTGDQVDDAVVPLTCDDGGVTRPQHVLVVSNGARVVGDLDLGRQQQTEHADVSALTASGSGVTVAWTAYQGAGFGKVRFTGRLARDGTTYSLDRDGSPLVVYQDKPAGVQVASAADVDRLTGAPKDFRAFVATLAGTKTSAGCTSAVTVARVRTDGYARGTVGDDCRDGGDGGDGAAGEGAGGALTIWSRSQGRWKAVITTQEGWYCSDLRKYLVPPDLMGADEECYTDDSGSATQPYTG